LTLRLYGFGLDGAASFDALHSRLNDHMTAAVFF
jgi:hypothetical protein